MHKESCANKHTKSEFFPIIFYKTVSNGKLSWNRTFAFITEHILLFIITNKKCYQ